MRAISVASLVSAFLFLSCRENPNLTATPAGQSPTPAPITCAQAPELGACSFNIQFLGNSSTRDNAGLAHLLRSSGCDLILVQELVAPPSEEYLLRNPLYRFEPYSAEEYARLPVENRVSPLGTLLKFPLAPEARGDPQALADPIKPQPKTTAFFDAMSAEGYAFVISEENTGPGGNHKNTSSAEWHLAFYDPKKFRVAPDLPHGFLSETRTWEKPWDRTPYAFPFRSADGCFDGVFINVHLRPNAGNASTARRREELRATREWIEQNCTAESGELDCWIIGDMNLENENEIRQNLPEASATAAAWTSLNLVARATNTNPNSPRPYDHVMLQPERSPSVRTQDNFRVIDLVEAMQSRWCFHWKTLESSAECPPYPGTSPYHHTTFRTFASDHHPVRWVIHPTSGDSDPSSATRAPAENKPLKSKAKQKRARAAQKTRR